MATEYYLVNEDKQEMYCLGKRLREFSNIKSATYGHKADYHKYEYFQEFLFDIIENNDYFMESMNDETWGNIKDFIHDIWEFIEYGRVLLLNDCSDDFSKYSNYKDAGSIYDFFEKKHSGG